MKFSSISIPVIKHAFNSAFFRFPFALIASFTAGLISIYLIEYKDKAPELQKTFFCLATGLPWFTGLHLIAENYLKNPSKKIILFVSGLIFLLLIYIFIAPDFNSNHLERPIRFLSFFLISHLLISLAPFIQSGNLKRFWEFNKDALVIWFIASFYLMFIYCGLAIALVAIDNLFEVRIQGKTFAEIFVILAACFHPVYVLSSFPTAEEGSENSDLYTRAIRVICLYILIPLTVIYFFILYAYMFKIIGSGNLPHGWVSSLVLGFSGLGMISYLLNYLFPDLEKSNLSILYKKYFFYILIPLVVLLFVAINRRISEYGITPPRYFVLITGIWLMLSSLYFVISKSENIKLIPLSLIAFLLFGTISPFDAFQVSIRSQEKRLISILEKNSGLENGKLKSSLAFIEPEAKESIKQIVYELDNLGAINNLNAYLTQPILFDTIVFHDKREIFFTNTGLQAELTSKSYWETIYLSSPEVYEYSLSGFSWMFHLNTNDTGRNTESGPIKKQGMLLILNKTISDTIQLSDLIKTLDERYQKSGDKGLLDVPFDVSTKNYKHLLYLKHIYYQRKDTALTANDLDLILLSGNK